MGKTGRRHTIELLSALLLAGAAVLCGAQGVAPQAASALRADPTLARALDLEAKGESRLAAEAYRLWIDAHSRLSWAEKDAPNRALYADVLLRFAETESDARLVEHFLTTAPLAVLPAAGRTRILAATAALLDSLGEVAAAQAAYEEASRADPEQGGRPARWRLWRSAALLYAEGGMDRAELQAREALDRAVAAQDLSLAADCQYLLGRVYAATGRPAEAEQIWRDLLVAQPDAAPAAGAYLGLWMLSTALGRQAVADEALAVLEKRFAGSPELELARLARGLPSRAVAALDPSALLEPYGIGAVARPRQAPAPAPKPATTTATTTTTVPEPAADAGPTDAERKAGPVAVLAGSYTDRANAEQHARKLAQGGFEASIVAAMVKGKTYYRVLVGEAGSYDAAMGLIGRLKDKNFESVPLPLTNGP